jgi:hypothetical protein
VEIRNTITVCTLATQYPMAAKSMQHQTQVENHRSIVKSITKRFTTSPSAAQGESVVIGKNISRLPIDA